MAKKTLREKNVETLRAWGFHEIPSRAGKYRTFQHERLEDKVFLGKNGAVRFGKCATKSRTLDSSQNSEGRTLTYLAKRVFG